MTSDWTRISLDRAASAYDRRRLAIAVIRAFILYGVSLAGLYLWLHEFWRVGSALLVAIVALVLLGAIMRFRRRLVARCVGTLLLVFAFVIGMNGVFAITAPAVIYPFPREADPALLLALQGLTPAYKTLMWTMARVIAVLPVLLPSLACLVVGGMLWRLSPIELTAVSEPELEARWRSWQSWLLDIPPGHVAYASKNVRSQGSLVGGALLIAAATAGIIKAPELLNLTAVEIAERCWKADAARLHECFRGYGSLAFAGSVLWAIVLLAVVPRWGARLVSRGRSAAALDAAERLKEDTRRPILFLRSFKNDAFALPAATSRWVSWLRLASSIEGPLDAQLLGEFMHVGPVRALGRPSEKEQGFSPFGALRSYPTDDVWKSRVIELAHAAVFVVLVLDERILQEDVTPLREELDMLAGDPQLLVKTVFLLRSPTGVLDSEVTRRLWECIGARGHFEPPSSQEPIVALQWGGERGLAACSKNPLNASAALVALRLCAARILAQRGGNLR